MVTKKSSKSKNPPKIHKSREEEEEVNNTVDISSSLNPKHKPVILLSGSINDNHLDVIHQLLELHYTPDFNDEIQLLINSQGGDTSVGWSIIDTMNFIRLPIHTIALGYVCSMAADIFTNGDIRTMGEHSTLMIHPHSSVSYGNHNQLLAAAKGDAIEHHRRLNHYLNNSKYTSLEEVQNNLFNTPGDDLYLSPDECFKHGLCDNIALSNKDKRPKPYHLVISSVFREPASNMINSKSKRSSPSRRRVTK